MSKELEILYKAAIDERETVYKFYDCSKEKMDKAYNTIKQALTPPTEQELCEELSAYMKEPVWFDDNKNIRISTQWLVKQLGKYGLEFMAVLPPRLIKRIAMFYEKESERDV